MRNHWLMKSEPDVYSIMDLKRDGRTGWEGVRNYQARNFMRDLMKIGDGVLFYHSGAEPPGVAGVAKIVAPASPDTTALDKAADGFDPKATKANPIWCKVDIEFVEAFDKVVSLADLRACAELTEMLVLRKGQRLSVQPVEAKHFERVVKMGRGTKG